MERIEGEENGKMATCKMATVTAILKNNGTEIDRETVTYAVSRETIHDAFMRAADALDTRRLGYWSGDTVHIAS